MYRRGAFEERPRLGDPCVDTFLRWFEIASPIEGIPISRGTVRDTDSTDAVRANPVPVESPPMSSKPQATSARDIESALLARCAAVAREAGQPAMDQREANVFRLAAMIVGPRFPGEAKSLMQASDRYFAAHPAERLAAAEVVTNGWVSSLPRLRDMLSQRLRRD